MNTKFRIVVGVNIAAIRTLFVGLVDTDRNKYTIAIENKSKISRVFYLSRGYITKRLNVSHERIFTKILTYYISVYIFKFVRVLNTYS